MNSHTKYCHEFGAFRLDPGEKVLYRDGRIVALPPKVFETLRVLVENHGHVVDKNYLMQQVWADTFVEEVGLARNISVLRKVLAAEPGGCSIETIPKRGYRFVGIVRKVGPTDPELLAAENEMPSEARWKRALPAISAWERTHPCVQDPRSPAADVHPRFGGWWRGKGINALLVLTAFVLAVLLCI